MAKPRKMLGRAEDPAIQALMRQMDTQSAHTLAAWAIARSSCFCFFLRWKLRSYFASSSIAEASTAESAASTSVRMTFRPSMTFAFIGNAASMLR